MSNNKTYSDVVCLVRNEIDSIRKRDGVLSPTAYVVMELGTRLKNLQAWEGYNSSKSHMMNLRAIVDEILKGTQNIDRPRNNVDMDVIWLSPNPYDVLEDSLGDRKAVGRSVDRCPTATKKEKLKKRLKQAS